MGSAHDGTRREIVEDATAMHALAERPDVRAAKPAALAA